jgi:hypothetical protein
VDVGGQEVSRSRLHDGVGVALHISGLHGNSDTLGKDGRMSSFSSSPCGVSPYGKNKNKRIKTTRDSVHNNSSKSCETYCDSWSFNIPNGHVRFLFDL